MTAAPRPKLTLTPKSAVDHIPRQTGKYTITPEMALHWINHLDNIRVLTQGVIDAYARDMKAGDWNDNGETIKWDVEDRCIDGEHRLRACVLAGVPFESWVVVGLPVSARKTIDLGHKRLLAQVLKNTGERYGTQMAGTATLLWRWNRGREGLYDTRLRPTYFELAHLIENNPRIRTSVELVHGSCGKAARLSRSSTVPALVHFLGSRNHPDRADTFLAQVHTGKDIGPGDPAYALREKLIKLGRQQNRFIQRETLGLWIPPWNAFAEGRDLRRYNPTDFDDPDQFVIL